MHKKEEGERVKEERSKEINVVKKIEITDTPHLTCCYYSHEGCG